MSNEFDSSCVCLHTKERVSSALLKFIFIQTKESLPHYESLYYYLVSAYMSELKTYDYNRGRGGGYAPFCDHFIRSGGVVLSVRFAGETGG